MDLCLAYTKPLTFRRPAPGGAQVTASNISGSEAAPVRLCVRPEKPHDLRRRAGSEMGTILG